jgi:transglutaminase-like putative cysteine protease
MRELLMREVVVCEACRRSGRVTLGTIADHVKPLAHGGSGNHLGWTVRAARHRHEQGELPTFTMGAGRTVYALRSTLAKHFARQEREVR